MSAPTPAEQVAFLGNIERLLNEGLFTATYKYALLVALADLAVERGTDDDSELELPISAIGEKFVEMYWRQAMPFTGVVADGGGGTLKQNAGRQAAMITRLTKAQRAAPTLVAARCSRAWPRIVNEATSLVTIMPLWRLQRLGKNDCEFLYARGKRRGAILLKPGIAANFRRFHGLVVRMAQSEWLRFVHNRPENSWLLGPTGQLSEFLFGSERRALARLLPGLRDLQHGSCFYCRTPLRQSGEVDHFIPWSRYPRDLGHNFVVAHRGCNAAKRDLLAAERHLERWVERSGTSEGDLADISTDAGFINDWPTSRSVALWSYSHADTVGANVWVAAGDTEALSGRWQALLR